MEIKKNMENKEVLSNKNIDDLRKIAISMGLIDHISFTRGDYYNFIVKGEKPVTPFYKKDELEAFSLTYLRELASEKGIEKSYKLKKSEIIDEILKSESKDNEDSLYFIKLNNMTISELKKIASKFKIEKIYSYKKNLLIKEILKAKDKHKNIDFSQYCNDILSCNTDMKEEIDTNDLSDNATEIIEEMQDINYIGGILDLHPDGYGFLRVKNYLPSEGDIYVSPSQIRKFRLRQGDKVIGVVKPSKEGENYNALIYIKTVNDKDPNECVSRSHFDNLTPLYPQKRFVLENSYNDIAMRIIDLISPIGKGQRGLIVSQPKSGKTTLLKKFASSISNNYPEAKLLVLLIDERPEEVTDMIRSVKGEVIYSTFDEQPKNHIKIAENTIERAKRLVEQKEDVVILLDSLTRLTRAYNLTTPPSGKTLSGGLDPLSLHKPKRFFGAARNIEEGGSLTILATALIDTGSRMDDIIFEEFKGTGNMEVHLDRKLSEKRIFPAIDIYKSGTRKEELLLDKDELEFAWTIRQAMYSQAQEEVTEFILDNIIKSKNNKDFINDIKDKINLYEK